LLRQRLLIERVRGAPLIGLSASLLLALLAEQGQTQRQLAESLATQPAAPHCALVASFFAAAAPADRGSRADCHEPVMPVPHHSKAE
jgi:hypothetical protein